MSLEWQPQNIESSSQNNDIEKNEENISIEKEITSEKIAKVMSIVDDIFQKDRGLTVLKAREFSMGTTANEADEARRDPMLGPLIREENSRRKLNTLKSVLETGILGMYTFEKNDEDSGSRVKLSEIKEKWMQRAFKEREGVVFGNIIGRDVAVKQGGYNKKDGVLGYFKDEFAFIYDLSTFSETLQSDERVDSDRAVMTRKAKSTGVRQYWARGSNAYNFESVSKFSLTRDEVNKLIKNKIIDLSLNPRWDDFLNDLINKKSIISDTGLNFETIIERAKKAGSFENLFGRSANPHADDGFVIGRRIAPRLFTGLVWDGLEYTDFQNMSPEVQNRFDQVVSTIKKSIYWLPIYDKMGNLLWPKQMSHEEVQKFVEERDAKNTNKE